MPKKKYQPDFTAEISTDTAALAIDVSRQRAEELKRTGAFGPPSDPLTLKSVSHGYIAFLRDEKKKSSKTLQESQLMAARRQKVELETAQMSGELIPADTAFEITEEIISGFRIGLSGLPSQITRNPVERHRIGILCGKILADVAALAAKRAEAVGARLKASGSDGMDGAGRMGSEEPEISDRA